MKTKQRKGNLFVIAGPSGVGKGTLVQAFLEKNQHVKLSISSTTRAPRPGEIHGVTYYYTDKDSFKKMVDNNELLEWAEFAGNYYGTYIKTVEDALNNGQDLILEIEVQGASQVKEKIKEAVLIFIIPPSFEDLEKRLRGRNTETEEAILQRLAQVKNEYAQKEKFDYILINDKIENAIRGLEEIMCKERNA